MLAALEPFLKDTVLQLNLDRRLKDKRGQVFSFRIFFNRQVTPLVTPQVLLTGLEERVLGEIKKDNKASRRLIAEKLDIKEDTVKEYINRLKQKGVLERIGGTSSGFWKVINY